MTPKEILIGAANLLSDPDRWIQKTMAGNRLGHSVAVDSPDASCFCTFGAMIFVSPPH